MQHALWLLGHPEMWFTIGVWLVCLVGAVKLALVLLRSDKRGLFALALAAFISLVAAYAWLVFEVMGLFVSGAPTSWQHDALNVLEVLLLGLALVSAIWIARDVARNMNI